MRFLDRRLPACKKIKELKIQHDKEPFSFSVTFDTIEEALDLKWRLEAWIRIYRETHFSCQNPFPQSPFSFIFQKTETGAELIFLGDLNEASEKLSEFFYLSSNHKTQLKNAIPTITLTNKKEIHRKSIF